MVWKYFNRILLLYVQPTFSFSFPSIFFSSFSSSSCWAKMGWWWLMWLVGTNKRSCSPWNEIMLIILDSKRIFIMQKILTERSVMYKRTGYVTPYYVYECTVMKYMYGTIYALMHNIVYANCVNIYTVLYKPASQSNTIKRYIKPSR